MKTRDTRGAPGRPDTRAFERAPAESLNLEKLGFTLIEVLLAVAVLSLGLIAVVGSFSRSLDAMGTAVSAVEATAVLEETVWRVKADPETYLRQGEGPVDGYGGRLQWKVEPRPEPRGLQRGDPLRHIWVSIGWSEEGAWRSVGASTLLWSPPAPSEEDL